MNYQRKLKTENADNIVGHFILAGFLLFDFILKVLNMILRIFIRDPHEVMSTNDSQSITTELKIFLDSKSLNELQDIISKSEIIDALNKSQLINLILENQEARKIVIRLDRKQSLKKMTNQELRNLLPVEERISRLKKSELIDLILLIENQ